MNRVLVLSLGIILTAAGILVMAAWLFGPHTLEAFSPNSILMVFNTALCFTLAGVALAFPASKPSARAVVQRLVACILIAFAVMTLWQDISGTSIGLDEWAVKVTIEDYNSRPGRMSLPTAMCFMFCGLVFILTHSGGRRLRGIMIQVLTLAMLVISIIGIAAASIRFELLYDWYVYGRMAVPTAICFLLLSTALWMEWYGRERLQSAYLEREEKRISVTGIAIIIAVALSAGMAGFGILAGQMERTLGLSLKETHRDHLDLIENNINMGVSGSLPITTRLLLNRYLKVFNKMPDDVVAQQIVQQDAASFVNEELPAVSIYSASGELVTKVGAFTDDPDFAVPLHLEKVADAKLLWKHGAILLLTLDIKENGEKIGSAVLERKLPSITEFLSKEGYLGATAETRICYALDSDRMQCLPSNRHPQRFLPEKRVRHHASTSMDLALKNQSGIRDARDYMDHQVVTAYGPIGDMGLGMVVKIDAAEFYGPIREKLQNAIGLILMLSALGIAIQHMQLLPLVKKLVGSEERLRSVNQFQQTLLDSANFSIIASTTDGVIQVYNKTAERMLGYSVHDVIGKMTPRIFHHSTELAKRAADLGAELGREILPGYEALVSKAASMGTEEREWTYVRKDGTYFPVLLSVSCLCNEAGEITGFLMIGMDITERKRLEKLKSEFISTVSHELRTPLTSIRGSLGLMKAGAVGHMASAAKEMTEIAYKNCERLILLINDILDIDKIESGEMRLDMKTENINHLVQQAVEANAAYSEKLDVRFAVTPLELASYVTADASRFIQVLSNLLSNAAKYSNPGDEVRITIFQRHDAIMVSVADHGPGIPKEFHSRIFRKFAQADSSSAREKSGTGLGLNISKQIIEHMNGSIGFTSVIGEGTTFWLSLPEKIPEVSSAQLEEAIAYLNEDNMHFLPRILHAEDDYDLCRIIAHSLQGRAIVHIAATVADASILLQSNSYDLLVLDMALPDGTGAKLLDDIKEAGLNTKVMILSASEVDEKIRGKVALAVVKSTISEDKVIEHIVKLVRKEQ